MRLLGTFLALVLAVGVTVPSAADETPFETILLPFYVYGSELILGAHGSEWQVDLWLRNDSDTDVYIGPCAPGFPDPTPGRTCVQGGHSPLARRATAVNPLLGANAVGRQGRLIYVRSDQRPEQLHFDLRVRDVRNPYSNGIQIPVVRSAQFRRGTTQLLNVPLRNTARSLLRIYDVDDRGAASRIRLSTYRIVNARGDEELVFRGDISFPPSHVEFVPGMPYVPGQIVFPLEQLLPLGTIGPLRVELEAASTGLRYWAFISTTDNATQNVTIVSPD